MLIFGDMPFELDIFCWQICDELDRMPLCNTSWVLDACFFLGISLLVFGSFVAVDHFFWFRQFCGGFIVAVNYYFGFRDICPFIAGQFVPYCFFLIPIAVNIRD